MSINQAAIVMGGAAAGGVKLIFVGACLAIGFTAGGWLTGKIARRYDLWDYARQEKKNPEPEENGDDTS